MDLTHLLALPPEACRLARWLLRQGEASAAEIAAHLVMNEAAALALLEALAAQGAVRREDHADGPHWRLHLAPRRKRQVPRLSGLFE